MAGLLASTVRLERAKRKESRPPPVGAGGAFWVGCVCVYRSPFLISSGPIIPSSLPAQQNFGTISEKPLTVAWWEARGELQAEEVGTSGKVWASWDSDSEDFGLRIGSFPQGFTQGDCCDGSQVPSLGGNFFLPVVVIDRSGCRVFQANNAFSQEGGVRLSGVAGKRWGGTAVPALRPVSLDTPRSPLGHYSMCVCCPLQAAGDEEQ